MRWMLRQSLLMHMHLRVTDSHTSQRQQLCLNQSLLMHMHLRVTEMEDATALSTVCVVRCHVGLGCLHVHECTLPRPTWQRTTRTNCGNAPTVAMHNNLWHIVHSLCCALPRWSWLCCPQLVLCVACWRTPLHVGKALSTVGVVRCHVGPLGCVHCMHMTARTDTATLPEHPLRVGAPHCASARRCPQLVLCIAMLVLVVCIVCTWLCALCAYKNAQHKLDRHSNSA
jgi:hypothetical protein